MEPIFTDDGKFFFCECGTKVSVDAKSCPSCGDTKAKAKAKKRALAAMPFWKRTIRRAVPWAIVGGIIFAVSKDGPAPSGGGGYAGDPCMFTDVSAKNSVERGVINGLSDPESFESVRARPLNSTGAGLRRYEIIFRTKNALGGVVTDRAIVTVDNRCKPVSTDFPE